VVLNRKGKGYVVPKETNPIARNIEKKTLNFKRLKVREILFSYIHDDVHERAQPLPDL